MVLPPLVRGIEHRAHDSLPGGKRQGMDTRYASAHQGKIDFDIVIDIEIVVLLGKLVEACSILVSWGVR